MSVWTTSRNSMSGLRSRSHDATAAASVAPTSTCRTVDAVGAFTSAIVAEPQLDGKVRGAQQRDGALQLVLGRGAHAHLITLNRDLYLLEFGFLHHRRELFRRFAVERGLECDVLVHDVAAALDRFTDIEVLYRHPAL